MNLDYILGEGEEVLGDEFVQAARSKGRIQLEEARSLSGRKFPTLKYYGIVFLLCLFLVGLFLRGFKRMFNIRF